MWRGGVETPYPIHAPRFRVERGNIYVYTAFSLVYLGGVANEIALRSQILVRPQAEAAVATAASQLPHVIVGEMGEVAAEGKRADVQAEVAWHSIAQHSIARTCMPGLVVGLDVVAGLGAFHTIAYTIP